MSFSESSLHVLLGVEAAVRGEVGFLEDVVSCRCPETSLVPFDHGVEEGHAPGEHRKPRHGRLSGALPYHGYSVIALDHALGGLHLGALVVGDVALDRLAGFARLVVIVFEPGPDLLTFCSGWRRTVLLVR